MGKKVDVDDIVKSTTNKYKKRMKKICACGTIWGFLGIAAIIIGIVFLVYFTKYWDDDDNWRRNLAYAGVGLIIFGLLFIAIGVVFCVALAVIWRRLSGAGGHKDAFVPPVYEHGKAPYPQQPPWPQGNPGAMPQGNPDAMPQGQAGSPGPHAPLQPQAPNPAMPSAPPADHSNVHIEVATNDKF